jgi:RNA polymerase sigma factor (sigma-70 family)
MPSASDTPLASELPEAGTAEASLVAAAQAYLEDLSYGRRPTPTVISLWRLFYQQYSPLLRRYARACGSPEGELDDAAQEMWLLLLIHLRDFRPASNGARFATWLYTLVHNRLANLARYRSRHRTQNLDPQRAARSIQSHDPSPRCEPHGLLRAVWKKSVARLPQRDQMVLYLRYVKNQGVPQIARSLGVSRSRVWTWHLRAKRRLRRLVVVAEAADGTTPSTCFRCEHFRECADGVLASCGGSR